MPDTRAGDTAIQPDGRNDCHRAVVSNLMSLIEHVQASLKLVELAIAANASSGGEVAANIVVLDDVTPRYVKAKATLNSCNASLGIAMHFLLDTRTSERESDGSAGFGRLRLV